ncbi:gag-aspartyl protease domain-containing protein [Tanacetum coccineum]|uniref:Gag-aspartyl protease domain-containing protein n=1 Tax=Tanacetum coccineum TaxID=301880 RepID=A0ABQ5BRA8_9ASTR
MSTHEDEGASDDESMGSMRILNARKAKTEVRTFVDSGATHNFMAVDEAKRLRINTTKGSGTIKAVNSEAKLIHEVAKDVWAKIGE